MQANNAWAMSSNVVAIKPQRIKPTIPKGSSQLAYIAHFKLEKHVHAAQPRVSGSAGRSARPTLKPSTRQWLQLLLRLWLRPPKVLSVPQPHESATVEASVCRWKDGRTAGLLSAWRWPPVLFVQINLRQGKRNLHQFFPLISLFCFRIRSRILCIRHLVVTTPQSLPVCEVPQSLLAFHEKVLDSYLYPVSQFEVFLIFSHD